LALASNLIAGNHRDLAILKGNDKKGKLHLHFHLLTSLLLLLLAMKSNVFTLVDRRACVELSNLRRHSLCRLPCLS
jgi:hypothetical protein